MPVKLREEDVIRILYEKYPDYDFSKFKYEGTYSEGIVICPEHGEVIRKYKDLIRTGSACRFCACRYDTPTFIQKILKSHPGDTAENYDFSDIEYTGINGKYEIFCKKHGGIFSQVGASLVLPEPNLLICPVCNVNNRIEAQYYDLDKFLSNAPEASKELDDFSDSKYLGSKLPIDIRCKFHNLVYSLRPNDYNNGDRCPKCSSSVKSKPEMEIFDLVTSWGIDAISRKKWDVVGGKEIDIYIPSKGIGIEYNGLFYHRKRDKRDRYNNERASLTTIFEKSTSALKNGSFIIQIFEDEWLYHRAAVENRLKSILGISERVYARDCELKLVTPSECKDFENTWHVQGHVSCQIALGLYLEGVLVSCMTFGRPRFESYTHNDSFEMLRFCASCSVVGGFSKILKNFIRTYNPSRVISYSDKRWGVGNVYKKNGFSKDPSPVIPGFHWVKGRVRYNRLNFQRGKLDAFFDKEFSKELTADDIMYEEGYFKVEDCGQDKWILEIK